MFNGNVSPLNAFGSNDMEVLCLTDEPMKKAPPSDRAYGFSRPEHAGIQLNRDAH